MRRIQPILTIVGGKVVHDTGALDFDRDDDGHGHGHGHDRDDDD
jgi:hypothetical protein